MMKMLNAMVSDFFFPHPSLLLLSLLLLFSLLSSCSLFSSLHFLLCRLFPIPVSSPFSSPILLSPLLFSLLLFSLLLSSCLSHNNPQVSKDISNSL
jgi:hypothetical protein